MTKKRQGAIPNRVLFSMSGTNDPANFFYSNNAYTNVFISGSTGSGKTSGSGYILASALLDAEDITPEERFGLIVFLYKKEDAWDWERWALAHNRADDIIHIMAHHADVFNPVEPYQDQEPLNAVNALMCISQISFGGERRESETFWEIEQRKRLDRLVRLCQLAEERLTITTLYQIHVSAPLDDEQLADKEFCASSFCWQLLSKAAELVGEEHPSFKLVEDYFLREMPYLAHETASSIRAMVSGILEPFVSSDLLKRMFCGTTKLKLEQAFSGKIILLDIPVQIHGYIGRIAQMILKYAFQKAVEQRNLREYPNPLIFWQDEAQAFLTSFDHSFMSTSRSSRAGSVLLSQNISNFYAALGGGSKAEAQVNSLLGLCNIKIFHANNDYVTNEWAAKTIGMGVRTLNSVHVGKEASSTTSQHMQYMVEPAEFTMLRTGGSEYDYLVDAVITGTGRIFSTGMNFLPATFEQPFAA